MRGDADGIRNFDSSSIVETNGSATLNGHKPSHSNTVNGAAKAASNGTSTIHTNGTSRGQFQARQPTFYGHDREEVTRILIQGLTDLGYDVAAEALSRESGYALETPYASAFRTAILQGDWEQAEALLCDSHLADDTGRVSIHPGSTARPPENALLPGNSSQGVLILSDDASRDEMLFLIRQQKYLELLEARDLAAALTVLQQDLQSLHQDERRLHALSSLLMCQSPEDLRQQADWDGAHGESRRKLLSDLSRSISPSAMIPEHRLAQLLTQIRDNQIAGCLYHNTSEPPSLYTDHMCERDDFPLQSIAELDTHKDEVWHLRFSNDGSMLATTSKDMSVAIHETTDFTTVHVFKDHTKPVTYVAWSPDDRYLLSCSMDCEARVWDIEARTCRRTITYFSEPASTAAWTPDGSAFIIGSLDRKHALSIWDARNQDKPDEPIYDFGDDCPRVQDCAICPQYFKYDGFDGYGSITSARPMRIVTVCVDHTLQMFDYQSRENLFNMSMAPQDITCVSISRDCQSMLINLKGGEIWIMDVDTGNVLQKFRGQVQDTFVIRSCFGGATEGFVVSGGEDSKISIWHRHSGRLMEQLDGHQKGCINAVSWNHANPSLWATAGDDHKVRIWSKPLTQQRLMEMGVMRGKYRVGQSKSSTPPAPTQTQQQNPPQWGSPTGESSPGPGSGVVLSPLLLRR